MVENDIQFEIYNLQELQNCEIDYTNLHAYGTLV